MTTNELQDKLYQKADRQLEADLGRLVTHIHGLFPYPSHNAHAQLNVMIAAYREGFKEKYRTRAIEELLGAVNQVQDLQSQLNYITSE